DSEKKNENSMDTCNKCLKLEVELVKKNDVYIEILKRFSNLEQHFISLEVAKQLNKEIFQKHKSSDNQNNPESQEYFEQNNLKAQLQTKDTIISKLKKTIYSLRENMNPTKVKKDIDEIETINIELEHSLAKLLFKNKKLHKEREHLKKTYKELYDLIKPSHVHAKEQCDFSIANLNSKSMENAYLKTQIQEKVFANATLKNELRKLKGRNVIDTTVLKPYATTISLGTFKLNLEPLALTFKHTLEPNGQFHDTLIQHMESLRKLILERAKHKREKDRMVNDRMMLKKKRKDNLSNALDADLVVMESNETESERHVLSSKSRNDTHTDDADINSVNDK
nr:hypothetical protein [Tanacetum cinerariifolium]